MGEQKRKGKKGSRTKRSKAAITTVIVVLCIVVIGVVDFVSRSNNSSLTKFDSARSKGSEDASVRILEFVDFQCPECARGSQLIQTYMLQHPDDIFLAVKYYPLGELNSMISALYGQCAAQQDKFWRMHDLLFERQQQWRTLRAVKPLLNIIAKDANLNINELKRCIESDSARSAVSAERLLGESNFVKSTPTYFINENIVVGVEELRKALEEFFENEI